MELLGYAQPCTAHPGETVEVKVSTTQPEFTAEVVRLGADHQPAASPAVRGRFPGQHHDLVGGSYFTAALGEPLPGPAGHAATLWFCPTRLLGRAVPDGRLVRGRRLGTGHRRGPAGQPDPAAGRG